MNFDSEFLDSAYDVKPEVAVYSLVNSLIEGTPASKVQITINGEKNAKIYGDDRSVPAASTKYGSGGGKEIGDRNEKTVVSGFGYISRIWLFLAGGLQLSED